MLRQFTIPKTRFIFNSTFHFRILPTSSQAIFFKMSSSTSSSNADQQAKLQSSQEEDHTTTQHKPQLTLPAPGDVAPLSSTNNLEVNGPDLKLDLLGPVVVNENGSMSRIDNWHEMSEIEKANVRRILVKRNNQRLAKLRAEQENQTQDQ